MGEIKAPIVEEERTQQILTANTCRPTPTHPSLPAPVHAGMHAAVQTHRRLLLLLMEEALSPADHRGVGAHEGDDVLLDLLAVKQGTPADAATIINTLDHRSQGDNTPVCRVLPCFVKVFG